MKGVRSFRRIGTLAAPGTFGGCPGCEVYGKCAAAEGFNRQCGVVPSYIIVILREGGVHLPEVEFKSLAYLACEVPCVRIVRPFPPGKVVVHKGKLSCGDGFSEGEPGQPGCMSDRGIPVTGCEPIRQVVISSEGSVIPLYGSGHQRVVTVAGWFTVVSQQSYNGVKAWGIDRGAARDMCHRP